MKSRSKSTDAQDPTIALALQVRAASARGAKLSKEQKEFKKLVNDIDALRAAIAQWHGFLPAFEHRLATKIAPLVARYRERHVQFVMLLSCAIDGKALGKRQKVKAIEIVHWHLADLLESGPDEALSALYDKYAEVPYEQEQTRQVDLRRRLAEELFGLDPDGEPNDKPARRKTTAKMTAREQAREALSEQLRKGASEAVRDIYRRLASELHPDREPDADERIRKTTLMQQANQAYATSDLLTLLGLQLQLRQLDTAALSELARERLLQYNYLLTGQRQQLREALAALTAPFSMGIAACGQAPTTDMLEHELARDARELKRAIKACETDVANFQDIRNIKHTLDNYRLGDLYGDDFSTLDDPIFDDLPWPPKRRRR